MYEDIVNFIINYTKVPTLNDAIGQTSTGLQKALQSYVSNQILDIASQSLVNSFLSNTSAIVSTTAPPTYQITASGFYGPSSIPGTIAVYLTQDQPIQVGWLVSGLLGLPDVTYAVTDFKSKVYGDVVMSSSITFPYVSMATVKPSIAVSVTQPSSLLQITFTPESVTIPLTAYAYRGPLVTSNTFSLYVISGNYPVSNGWLVNGLTNASTGLLDVTGNVVVQSIMAGAGVERMLTLSSMTVNNQPYIASLVVKTDNVQVFPNPGSNVLVTFNPPGSTEPTKYYSIYDPNIFDASTIRGKVADLYELNSNVLTDVPAPRDALIEMTGRGFGTGALTAIAAIGPQEKYMFGGQSLWMDPIIQHTAFAQTHRMLLPIKTSDVFLDPSKQYSVTIPPRESGDLLANMHLSVSLPALPSGYSYSPLVGRAIFQKVEFLIDGQTIETLTDDWYIIRDQLFLDADEKNAMYAAVSAGYNESTPVPGTSAINMIIPLDFFFCRRHGGSKKGRERVEKPFFPLCAMLKQIVTIRFTFNSAAWITNAPTDVNGKKIDIINPQLMIEEITLTPHERMYYQSQPITLRVNHVFQEAGQPYRNGTAVMNLTADFPVTMLTWFVRNNLYNSHTNSTYYDSRYNYGYSTDFIKATVPVTFFNGVTTNFVDIIKSGTLYLNNKNVLSNFPGSLYYSYQQAIEHKLSVPTKNIYMYCFGENPREYSQNGYLDFSTLNSDTTHLDLIFNPDLVTQITQSYTLNLFYYGYVNLHFSNGFAALI